MRKRARLASRSRKFCAKIQRKNCKVFEILARSAHKSCVHSAGMLSVRILHSVAEVDRVVSPFRSEKARDGREGTCHPLKKLLRNFLRGEGGLGRSSNFCNFLKGEGGSGEKISE